MPVAKSSKSKPAKKKSSKSKKEEVVVEKVVEEVKDVAEKVSDVVAEALEEPTNVSYSDEFGALVKMADDILQMARTFKSRLGKLEKTVAKEHKQLEKRAKGKKRRVANPDAPPSGFAKPGPVSPELAKFLGLGNGELIARTEVTKAINAYCKEHNLQNGLKKY